MRKKKRKSLVVFCKSISIINKNFKAGRVVEEVGARGKGIDRHPSVRANVRVHGQTAAVIDTEPFL